MKFSENWLRSMVDPPLSSEALAHALTMAGFEVETRAPVAPPFDKVVVAEVQTVGRHPHADRLTVCRVDVGTGSVLTIVCGAPNVHAGIRVPCALPGAQLPGLAIKVANVRGVESHGMLCSARELGLSEDASGLLLLAQDAPVGLPLREYLDLDDQAFELKLTPNRADCLSVSGIAREVAAITQAPLRPVEFAAPAPAIADRREIVLDAPKGCPRYCGRVVRGVDARAPTPQWMVRRLERSGVRPISAIVDVTNYVMLELGQPLHAFDHGRLEGAIHVRYPRIGERLALLNGSEIDLTPDLLLIADEAKPVALAGIMGGRDTAVSDATVDVFLESAFFTAAAVAGKTRTLGFSTDAAHRFERGVDYAQCAHALDRAAQLLIEICGGTAGPISETCAELPKREPITLRSARSRRILGVDLAPERITALLARLRLGVERDGESETLRVTPPSYRFDLSIEEDLVEEVGRIHGYDNIAATPPQSPGTALPCSEARRSPEAVRRLLVARDYQEMISYSFVDAAWERDFCGNDAPVALANPIASQMSVMRSSLIGSLVDTLRFNLSRKQNRVRLFEVGRCFNRAAAGAFVQPTMAGGICHGGAVPEQWGMPERSIDFYDVKSDVEALVYPETAQFEPAPHPALHPGKSARVLIGGIPAGWLGELHPQWRQKYEIPGPAIVFELELDVIVRRTIPVFQEVSRFPPVRRDMAFIVDESVAVGQMLASFRAELPPRVVDVSLFDEYRGKGLESGKKSLAFRVLLQDTQKTLTDAEVESAVAQLRQIAQRSHQAKLRA